MEQRNRNTPSPAVRLLLGIATGVGLAGLAFLGLTVYVLAQLGKPASTGMMAVGVVLGVGAAVLAVILAVARWRRDDKRFVAGMAITLGLGGLLFGACLASL
jgi:hypothetical protein